MNLKNTIFFKNLRTLYKINLEKSNEAHSVLISALYNVFIVVGEDIDQSRLEMCLSTATGQWLDSWGEFFNTSRAINEADQDYSKRIIEDTIEPKVTVTGLKKAAARYINRKFKVDYDYKSVNITEPWKSLLKPSHSGTLSGEAKLWSPDYWTYGVIDIALPDATMMSLDLIVYLNTIKAAGTKITWSIKPDDLYVIGYFLVDPVDLEIFSTHSLIGNLYLKDSPVLSGFSNQASISYIDRLASGKQLIWAEPVGLLRDFPLNISKIRQYEESGITSLFDISIILGKDYNYCTIGDLLNLERSSYLDVSALLDVSFSLSTDKPYDTSILSNSLANVSVTSLSDITQYVLLANNQRYLTDSPLFNAMKDYLGSYTADEINGKTNFFYEDCNQTFYSWLTLDKIASILGYSADSLTLDIIEESQVAINNYLLKEQTRIENYMLPTQITQSVI